MDKLISYDTIESAIIEIRNQKILLDYDVAVIYGVDDVKRINEAVKNNPEKFPSGYILELSIDEWESLRSKVSTLKKNRRGQHRKYIPKAFTEKGLYMLATILKSKNAAKTTISIIETYAKIRELTQTIKTLSNNPEKTEEQSLMKKSDKIISEILDKTLQIDESETTIEINFAVLKFKHTIKKKDK